METVQWNQLATEWLADYPRERCLIGNSVLVSADSRLGTQCVQLGHPWWAKVHVSEPMNNVYSCPIVTCSWSHWVKTELAVEKGWLLSTEWVILYILMIKILFCCSHPSVSIHMGHKYLHFFQPFRDIYPHTTFTNSLVIHFPIMFLPSPWPSSQYLWSQPMIQCIIILVAISPSKESEQTGALLAVLPAEEYCPSPSPLGRSRKGATLLQLSISGGACIRTFC